MLNGQAEAAAVSYYVLDKDKHLTVEQRAKLKKVAEQGPVPTHVIAVRSSISEADRDTLRKALETMNEKENEELRDKALYFEAGGGERGRASAIDSRGAGFSGRCKMIFR